MKEAIVAFGPLILFMLIPIWIPIITAGVGWLRDSLTREETPSQAQVVLRARDGQAPSVAALPEAA